MGQEYYFFRALLFGNFVHKFDGFCFNIRYFEFSGLFKVFLGFPNCILLHEAKLNARKQTWIRFRPELDPRDDTDLGQSNLEPRIRIWIPTQKWIWILVHLYPVHIRAIVVPSCGHRTVGATSQSFWRSLLALIIFFVFLQAVGTGSPSAIDLLPPLVEALYSLCVFSFLRWPALFTQHRCAVFHFS